MPTDTQKKFELTVIGAGMAGMAAALYAADRGLSTAIAGSSAEIIFASGYIDLLGVHPVADKRIWDNPWTGIESLVKKRPLHPYARVHRQAIGESIDSFIGFLEKAGLSYRRKKNRNVKVISPMGTVKPTYGVPRTMWNAVAAYEKKSPCLIVQLDGLKGFSARLIAETLKPVWPDLKPVRISYPDAGRRSELYTERIANELELAANREKFARQVRPHIGHSQAVAIPAICGLYQTDEVFADLQQRLGVPVFEIPTMPPSVPGLRIKVAAEKQLASKGVHTFFHQNVLRARRHRKRGFVLEVGSGNAVQSVSSDAVILASGRFLGRGLHAERKRIRETVFGLPVYQPGKRSKWHRMEFLDPGGHPINRAGLEIDESFRPLNGAGRPAHPLLFAAGSILAHQDWMRQKCGGGLALATAFGAVNACLQLRG